MRLSQRILRAEVSRTTRFTPLIQRLRQEGRDIVSLAVGELDRAPDPTVTAAIHRSLDQGETRYAAVPGLIELREALAARFEGLTSRNILITNGAKQGLYNLFQVLCDPGDEVIIPTPCWVSFPEQVKLAGGKPVRVPLPGPSPDPERLAAAVTGRTRAILVNSPNNPTGAVYSREFLRAVADLALRHDLWIVSDEAYDALVYDGHAHVGCHDMADIRSRLAVVKSFSKTCCMTGLRVGYVAGPDPLMDAMSRLQSHLTGNVCPLVQRGALAALPVLDAMAASLRAEMQRLRDIAHAAVSQWAPCEKPAGAFYLFPDVTHLLEPGETSEDFAARVLEHAGVAVVPGEAFFGPGRIRISYALEEASLRKALDRLARHLSTTERGRS